MDLSKLSREDLMILVGGILLFIGLIAFPWYSVFSLDVAATSSPYAIWGILALIVTIVILLDFALARFSPGTQIPTLGVGRDMTRLYLCGILDVLLFIKFLAHVGDFGWGFFIDVILAIVVTVGVWFVAQGRSTPISSTASGA